MNALQRKAMKAASQMRALQRRSTDKMAAKSLIRQAIREDRHRLTKVALVNKRDFEIVRRCSPILSWFVKRILLFVIAARRKTGPITALSRKEFAAPALHPHCCGSSAKVAVEYQICPSGRASSSWKLPRPYRTYPGELP